jgi:hypothetical protein
VSGSAIAQSPPPSANMPGATSRTYSRAWAWVNGTGSGGMKRWSTGSA